MSKELKARVAALEAEVAELRALVDGDEDDGDDEEEVEPEPEPTGQWLGSQGDSPSNDGEKT